MKVRAATGYTHWSSRKAATKMQTLEIGIVDGTKLKQRHAALCHIGG